jgi:hypothetical protein
MATACQKKDAQAQTDSAQQHQRPQPTSRHNNPKKEGRSATQTHLQGTIFQITRALRNRLATFLIRESGRQRESPQILLDVLAFYETMMTF